jgi:hypothetical protein
MILYFIELISLIIFWKFADFKRFQELIPIMFTAAFLRFFDHYIVIDWLQLWTIKGHPIWTPFSANVTVWTVAVYLFIQYLPLSGRLAYGLAWVALMLGYLSIIKWAKVISFRVHWNLGYSFLVLCGYFTLVFLVWSWLYPEKQGKGKK